MTVTLKDISEATGFEVSTVSKVLRGDKRCYASKKTQQIISDAAKRLDYVPNHFARGLKTRRSHTIGIVGNLGGFGVDKMFRAIARELPAKGYMPLLCESYRSTDGEEQALRELRGRSVDGVILQTSCAASELARILPEGIPCVLIRTAGIPGCPSLVLDRSAAFAEGVRWLAARGHARIAFIYAEYGKPPTGSTGLKLAGYRAAMEELGQFDEDLLLPCGPEPGEAQDFVVAHAEAFRRITAVLAANDRIAIEVMSGLARLGLRVPEDCSVIGFDNTEYAEATHPRLTSFDSRLEETGATAVRLVLDLIDGRPVEGVTLQAELVERESTGPCRKL